MEAKKCISAGREGFAHIEIFGITMTKADLINIIAQKLGEELNSQQISQAVRVILDSIANSLLDGERVEIRGIGTFSKRSWGPRYARNPFTKESWMTPSKTAIHFKAGKLLKDAVNQE